MHDDPNGHSAGTGSADPAPAENIDYLEIGFAGQDPVASPLEDIFASIRSGETPWTLDELPADTGAANVLLSELDRLWANPE